LLKGKKSKKKGAEVESVREGEKKGKRGKMRIIVAPTRHFLPSKRLKMGKKR